MLESPTPGERVTTGTFLHSGKVFRPLELYRCAKCGELRGTLVGPSLTTPDSEITVTLTCKCEWITCSWCGKGKIPRPISNDLIGREVWHNPWFSYLARCEECQAEQNRAEEERRRMHPLALPEYLKALRYAYGLHPDQEFTQEEYKLLADKLMEAVGRPQYTRAELEATLREIIAYAERGGHEEVRDG